MRTTVVRTALAALLAAALPSPAGAADEPALRAEAGLQGLARPGRWTPVRVAVENGSEPLAGELVVEWGDVRARRALTLAPTARRQFEMYVRTANVRDVMVVRLEAAGRPSQQVEAPVRVVRFDEPLVVCLGSPSASSPDATACTVALTAESFPASWRGYDAVDDVLVEIDPRTMPVEKQDALELWRRVHALQESAALRSPLEPADGDAVAPTLQAGYLVYLAAIPACLFLVRRSAAGPRQALAAAAALVVVVTTAAAAIGRTGPASAVVVRASGIAHQFPGSARSFVVMRATAEFPSAAQFELRVPVADGAIDAPGHRGMRDDQRYDDSGYPIVSGRFALGAKKAFALDGVAELAVVEVSRRATALHVANVSSDALDDCTVRVGTSDRPIGALAAGTSLDIAGASGEAMTLSCTAPARLLPFSAADRRVVTDGRLQIVVHLPVDPAQS